MEDVYTVSYKNIPSIYGYTTCPEFSSGESLAINQKGILRNSFSVIDYDYYECSYTKETLQNMSADDIVNYKNTFLFNRSNNYEQALNILNTVVYPTYCLQSLSSSECPPNPNEYIKGNTGPMNSCSSFLNTINPECQVWSAENPSESYEVKKKYCDINKYIDPITNVYTGPQECDCINKSYIPLYKAVKCPVGGDCQTSLDGNITCPSGGDCVSDDQTHCWFIPCANPSFYLSDPFQVNGECEDKCGIYVTNANDNVTIIPPENIYIKCNDTENNKAVYRALQLDKANNTNDDTTTYIIIAIIIFVVLFVIIVIILVVRNNKNKKELNVN
jgi:hypothetical protein